MHPLFYFKQRHHERQLLRWMGDAQFGIKASMVERLPELFDRKPVKGETYYYYNGPNDEKTRPFCKRMLEMDKVFSQTDIDILSNYLGYDVLSKSSTFGPGAFNCRHSWVKFRGKVINTPAPTVRQLRDLISKGINLK